MGFRKVYHYCLDSFWNSPMIAFPFKTNLSYIHTSAVLNMCCHYLHAESTKNLHIVMLLYQTYITRHNFHFHNGPVILLWCCLTKTPLFLYVMALSIYLHSPETLTYGSSLGVYPSQDKSSIQGFWIWSGNCFAWSNNTIMIPLCPGEYYSSYFQKSWD